MDVLIAFGSVHSNDCSRHFYPEYKVNDIHWYMQHFNWPVHSMVCMLLCSDLLSVLHSISCSVYSHVS